MGTVYVVVLSIPYTQSGHDTDREKAIQSDLPSPTSIINNKRNGR
jgi:hypothetical protein